MKRVTLGSSMFLVLAWLAAGARAQPCAPGSLPDVWRHGLIGCVLRPVGFDIRGTNL